ncbi:2'-5' RNA ligase family protein [Legionella spiritensis]|uniref:2'-5' RNA ligase family protein n=1 Tax=Legionella spiritensis TaxID=452 RepID=UPI000F6C9CEC|nr:2'-5' RNA ligase family protein [Legionella spiritensis]VEG91295.1 Uncharacterised protein [Legionella spiritensis]
MIPNCLKAVVVLSLLLITRQALAGQSINVYLIAEQPAIYQTIADFNRFLKNEGLLDNYQITPFLKSRPIHVTLYLTEYRDDKLARIIRQVEILSRRWSPIDITATEFFVTAGNYVMLDITLPKQPDGSNNKLRQLSDDSVFRLHPLRDFNARIPDWAQAIPAKREAFERYGSPNVFFEFAPHISIMAKTFQDTATAEAFQKKTDALINKYRHTNPHQPVTFTAATIGVGYTDDFGQVTREIVRFRLSKSP